LPCTIQIKQIHIWKRSLDIFCHAPFKQNKFTLRKAVWTSVAMHHSNKTNTHYEKQSGHLLPCTIQIKQIHIRKSSLDMLACTIQIKQIRISKSSLDICCHAPFKQNKFALGKAVWTPVAMHHSNKTNSH